MRKEGGQRGNRPNLNNIYFAINHHPLDINATLEEEIDFKGDLCYSRRGLVF